MKFMFVFIDSFFIFNNNDNKGFEWNSFLAFVCKCFLFFFFKLHSLQYYINSYINNNIIGFINGTNGPFFGSLEFRKMCSDFLPALIAIFFALYCFGLLHFLLLQYIRIKFTLNSALCTRFPFCECNK